MPASTSFRAASATWTASPTSARSRRSTNHCRRAGGPLAFVEDGDVISIDVRRKAVDLEVPESVLAERRKTARVYGAQDQRGWLGVYQRTVVPVHGGAVLKGR